MAARRAAESPGPVYRAEDFLDHKIRRRDELILPLHGGPVTLDPHTVALRDAISHALDRVLARGQAEGTIAPDITSGDIIIMGALLAHPLPRAPDWDQTARRRPASISSASPPAAPLIFPAPA